MHNSCYTSLMLLFVMQAVVAQGQTVDDRVSSTEIHEFWSLKSTDGRSHTIEAIAIGKSKAANVFYVVESAQKLLQKGATGAVSGEFIFWKLDETGKVIHKQVIGKMSDGEPPRVTIVPLPEPQEGAIIIGMFDKGFGWSLSNVDADGKIAKSTDLVNAPGAFLNAALLPDAKSLLLAGQYGSKGNVWKVDLDGNVIWKRTYRYEDKAENGEKTIGDDKPEADSRLFTLFYSIALADEEGGFLVAGDFGEISKSGMSDKQLWLLRCDEVGKVISEKITPGRLPSMCTLGNEQYAVLYDTSTSFQWDGRVRAFDQEIVWQWEKGDQFATAFMNDGPTIGPIPSSRGFVVAPCNNIRDDNEMRQELKFFQYDTNGKVVSSASTPILQRAFLHTRVVCGDNHAYIAAQTSGLGPSDAKEASIFEVLLRE